MGERFSYLAQPGKVSTLIVDADLNLGVRKLIADTANIDNIDAKTAGHNIAALTPIVNSDLRIQADVIEVDTLREKTPSHGIAGIHNILSLVASENNLVLGADFGGNNPSAQTICTFTFPVALEDGGTVHVRVDASVYQASTVTIVVKKNGTPVGSAQTSSAIEPNRTTLNWDTTVNHNDVVTIEGYNANSYWYYAKNMRIAATPTYSESTPDTPVKPVVNCHVVAT